MSITLHQTEKLLKSNLSFAQLGFSMLLTRLKTLYGKDHSITALQGYTNEINVFLQKFKSIMENDYEIITKL